MSAASIRAEVTTTVDGLVLTDVKHTFGVSMAGKEVEDRFTKVCKKDGKARVVAEMTEKMPGPGGSYSSIAVMVSVSLQCDQTELAVREAGDAAFEAAYHMTDAYIDAAVVLLDEHLRKHR